MKLTFSPVRCVAWGDVHTCFTEDPATDVMIFSPSIYTVEYKKMGGKSCNCFSILYAVQLLFASKSNLKYNGKWKISGFMSNMTR